MNSLGNVPGLKELCATPAVASPGGRHATRKLDALSTTPLGSARARSAEVNYSLPSPSGESESAAKRRCDRHRKREELKLRSLDLSGAAEKHAAAEAERLRAARRDQREVEDVLRDCIEMVWRAELVNTPLALPPPGDPIWADEDQPRPRALTASTSGSTTARVCWSRGLRESS